MSDAEDEYQEAVDMFPEESIKRADILHDESPMLRAVEPVLEPSDLDDGFVVVPHRGDRFNVTSPAPIPPTEHEVVKTSKLKELAWGIGKDVLIQAGSLLLQSAVQGTAGGFITAVGVAGVSRLMSSGIRCGRCGYASHTTSQCFAVRNIYGAFIPKR